MTFSLPPGIKRLILQLLILLNRVWRNDKFYNNKVYMSNWKKNQIETSKFTSKLYWLAFYGMLCWMFFKLWYHWFVKIQLLMKLKSFQKPFIHNVIKGLTLANLSPFGKFRITPGAWSVLQGNSFDFMNKIKASILILVSLNSLLEIKVIVSSSI